MQNFSYFVLFGTDNLVGVSEKSTILNNFEQELVSSCILPIRQRRAKGAPAWTIFDFDLKIFKFKVKL